MVGINDTFLLVNLGLIPHGGFIVPVFGEVQNQMLVSLSEAVLEVLHEILIRLGGLPDFFGSEKYPRVMYLLEVRE